MSDGKTPLDSTSDAFGNAVRRGSYIVYPYLYGHSARLRAAKVVDIYEDATLTWLGPEVRLKVVGITTLWPSELALTKPIRLNSPGNVVVVTAEQVAAEQRALLDQVEVVPFVEAFNASL